MQAKQSIRLRARRMSVGWSGCCVIWWIDSLIGLCGVCTLNRIGDLLFAFSVEHSFWKVSLEWVWLKLKSPLAYSRKILNLSFYFKIISSKWVNANCETFNKESSIKTRPCRLENCIVLKIHCYTSKRRFFSSPPNHELWHSYHFSRSFTFTFMTHRPQSRLHREAMAKNK